MVWNIFLFLLIGIILGIGMGLIPGLHPNLILLLTPIIAGLGLEPVLLISLIVPMSVVNAIVDFIPSLILGAPDAGSELAVLPGHKMLMQGFGYWAVKLTVFGGLFAAIFCVLLIPVFALLIPFLYEFIRPLLHVVLLVLLVVMIFTDKKLPAAFCVVMSGLIGLLSQKLPLSSTLTFFPIFTGFFGLSMLVLQMRNKPKLPKQSFREKSKLPILPALSGGFGGVLAGILPGVGQSQIAAFFSFGGDQNFLVNLGAISTANIVLSFLAIWLINNPRSGAAILLDQFISIGPQEVLLLVALVLISAGLAVLSTLFLAKKILKSMERIDYNKLSFSVIIFLVVLIEFFTGIYGLFLAGLCTMLGLYANLTKVRRSTLMAVLIIHTILYFLGL